MFVAPNRTLIAGLTIDEVCESGLWGRTYIYGEIDAGRLRAVKFGGLTRILPEDFAAWLASAPAIVPSSPTTIPADRSSGDSGELIGHAA